MMDGLGFNYDGIEIFWAIMTWGSLIRLVGLLMSAYADRHFVRVNNLNGARKIVTDAFVQKHWVKVAIALSLSLAVMVSGLYDSPLPPWARAAVFLLLSAVPPLLMVLSILDSNERSELDDYFKHHPITPDELPE